MASNEDFDPQAAIERAYRQQSAAQYVPRAQAPQQVRRPRRLDAINAAADETARLAERLDGLVCRFGGGPDGVETGAEAIPISVSYSSSLDRLQANIGRISKALDEVEEFA